MIQQKIRKKRDLFFCSFSVQLVKSHRTKDDVMIKKLSYVKL